MSKLASSFFTLLLLLLFFTVTYAARPQPVFITDSAVKPLHQDVEAEKQTEAVGESCEGVADKDECLMRRTLAAHVDYIYTQKHNP